LLALSVKETDYDVSNVDVFSGGQYEPELMSLNPEGQVPILKDGEQVVTDSEKIIEYIDREITTGPILIPSVQTKEGKEIAKWRKMLGRVKVDILTTGIVMYPELSVSETKFPRNMTADGKCFHSLSLNCDIHRIIFCRNQVFNVTCLQIHSTI
ncbi:hypothetical protein FSP39_020534, partial [Pinctada imbricata]